MGRNDTGLISRAKKAAIEVLLHNSRGPFKGLPRTAGWGYPEPYTRDLLISSLGVLASGNERLIKTLRRVLETLAKNQSQLGHIPSLVHDGEDRGASDTTPLFIMTIALYRKVVGETGFLEVALQKAMKWMEYQSPTNRFLVAQLPTSDWRDEQWVLGYGLYVNTIVYTYLRLFGRDEQASNLQETMDRFTILAHAPHRHVHEGLKVRNKPYYALWSYKVYRSERFDLLGNSLAIISGLASLSRAKQIISWTERETANLKESGDLAVDMPPNLFPFIRPADPDWMPRYDKYNRPGEYHNGGIWPFICGFYVAALVAAGRYKLAQQKLLTLTELVRPAKEARVEFGFNEWIGARDCKPAGQDWQSWSAAMYLYAASCVEQKSTIFFDQIRD
jgi:hypothetical protein